MGGTVIETESEKLIKRGIQQGIYQGMRQGKIQMIIEMCQEAGLEDAVILAKIQEKVGLSIEEAHDCLKQYGK